MNVNAAFASSNQFCFFSSNTSMSAAVWEGGRLPGLLSSCLVDIQISSNLYLMEI